MIKYLFFCLFVAILGTMPIYAEEKRPIDKIQTSEGLSQLMDGVLLLDKIEKKLKKQSEFFKVVKNAKQLQKVNASLAQIKGITRKISGNPIISKLNKAITYGNFAVEATNYATGLNDSELAELDVIVSGVNIAFSKLGATGVVGSFVLDTSYGTLNKFNKVLNDLNEQRLSDIDHTSQVFLYATDIRNSGSHDIDKDGINESGLILDIIQSSEIQDKSNAEIISSIEIRYQKSIDNFVSIIEIYNNQYQEKLEKLNNRLICEFTCKENKKTYSSIIASNKNYIKNMKRAKSDFFDNSKYLSLINTYIDNARAVHDDLSVELAQYKKIPLLRDTQNTSIYEDIPPPPTFATNEEEENQYTPPQEEINPDVEDALTDNIKEESNSNRQSMGFSSGISNKQHYFYSSAVQASIQRPNRDETLSDLIGTGRIGLQIQHFEESGVGGVQEGYVGGDVNIRAETIHDTPSSDEDGDSRADYAYLGWGDWNSNQSFRDTWGNREQQNIVHGHYLIGIKTNEYPDRGRYPTGNATYNGSIQGDYVNVSGTRELNAITGSINMNVNFGNNTLSGSINAQRSGSNWATANFSNTNFNRSENRFQGQMSIQNGGRGQIEGSFYGNEAQEVGGAFYIDKQHGDAGGASGIFRAKK